MWEKRKKKSLKEEMVDLEHRIQDISLESHQEHILGHDKESIGLFYAQIENLSNLEEESWGLKSRAI